MSVHGYAAIIVLHINRIPRTVVERTVLIKLTIVFIKNSTGSSSYNLSIVVVKLVPRKRPKKNVNTRVVISGSQIIGALSTVIIKQLIGKCRIVVNVI